MNSSKTMRTFIACPIPKETVQSIKNVQEKLKKYNWKIRWTPVENIHLTLSFLGNINLQQKINIEKTLEPLVLSQKVMKFQLGNLGVFPSTNRPNILWIGLSGDNQDLIGFQKKVQTELIPLGFPVDKRPFKAHLTIGRVKGRIPKNQLGDALCMDILSENYKFCFDSVVFYQSILSPQGATYKVISRNQFTGISYPS